MAFPTKPKRPSMPPPEKKPDLVVAIGAGKPPKPGDDAAVPKDPTESKDPKDSSADAGGVAGTPGPDSISGPGDNPADEAGEKMSPERAIVVREHEHCRNCENYHPEDGSCEEVEGQFSPEDACFANFEPIGDEQPDEMGGPPMPEAGGRMPPPGGPPQQ